MESISTEINLNGGVKVAEGDHFSDEVAGYDWCSKGIDWRLYHSEAVIKYIESFGYKMDVNGSYIPCDNITDGTMENE